MSLASASGATSGFAAAEIAGDGALVVFGDAGKIRVRRALSHGREHGLGSQLAELQSVGCARRSGGIPVATGAVLLEEAQIRDALRGCGINRHAR